MTEVNQDQLIRATFSAWEAVYDLWEQSQRAADKAVSTGQPESDIEKLFLQADLLRESARQLFDQYVEASGGKIDTGPGPLPDDGA